MDHGLTESSYVEAHVATIGVYEPVAAWLIEGTIKSSRNAEMNKPTKGVHSPEYDKVAELTRFLSPTFLQGYNDAMNLIFCLWNVEQTDRMHDLIHATCQRANNYEYRWVQNLIRSWKYSAFSVGSLVVWATASTSKDAVSAVLKRFAVTYQNELFDRSMVPSRHTTIHERYVPPLIFENSRTIILQSHLGTGKTVAISEMIQYGRYERILIVSPRKSYTYSQIGALRQAATSGTMPFFESYLDHSGPLGHLPYLILQAESLWRIKGAEDYDLVIMDESESILCQMHSVVTHGPHMIDNHVVLETVLRGSLRAVFADAFVSDRTFHAVRELRDETTHFIENTYQPYDRTAISLAPIHKDKRVANLGALCERIMEALKAGRKIVVLWTSKKRGLWFAKQFLAISGNEPPTTSYDPAKDPKIATDWKKLGAGDTSVKRDDINAYIRYASEGHYDTGATRKPGPDYPMASTDTGSDWSLHSLVTGNEGYYTWINTVYALQNDIQLLENVGGVVFDTQYQKWEPAAKAEKQTMGNLTPRVIYFQEPVYMLESDFAALRGSVDARPPNEVVQTLSSYDPKDPESVADPNHVYFHPACCGADGTSKNPARRVQNTFNKIQAQNILDFWTSPTMQWVLSAAILLLMFLFLSWLLTYIHEDPNNIFAMVGHAIRPRPV
jgi:hypothetical protein